MNGEFLGTKWNYDVVAESYGILAFLPFGEVKFEIRKNPAGVCKMMEIAAMYAYETTYFNIVGRMPNPYVEFIPQQSIQKKVREFFSKNVIVKSFLHGLEKRDERLITQSIGAQQFEPGDRVIRKDTRDRALFFVIQGEFFTLDKD